MIIIKPIDFDLAKVRLKHRPADASKAISQSINFGLRKSKTEVSRELRQFYAIKQKDIYAAIPNNAFKWSSEATLNGKLLVASPRLRAILFNPQPAPVFETAGGKGPKLRRGKKLSVEIRKGQRVNMRPGVFYARGSGGTPNMFERTSAARYPIRAIITLSIARMLSSQKVMPRVSVKVRGLVAVELARQINRFMNQPKT